MRVPQVSERIKEAPAQALRGVFAGIGQLLLITDKLRHKTPADQDVPRARTPETAETVTDTSVTTPAGTPGETVATTAPPASAAPPASTATPAAAEPADAQAVTAEPVTTGPVTTGPVTTGPVTASPVLAEPTAAAEPVIEPEATRTGEAVPAKPAARRTAAKSATKSATAKPAAAKPAAKAATTRRAAKPAADPEATEVPKPPKRQSTRNFDKTGNVRLIGDEAGSPSPVAAVAEPIPAEPIATPEPIATFEPPVVAEPVAAPETVIVSEPAAAPEAVAAPEPVVAAVTGAEPPMPNYDALTVASLRARLRNLDVAQVRLLAEYERAHAARADVLGMYERRIAKLEAEA